MKLYGMEGMPWVLFYQAMPFQKLTSDPLELIIVFQELTNQLKRLSVPLQAPSPLLLNVQR